MPRASWGARAVVAAAALAACGVPLVAFARLVLFHFYVRGSFLLDSGLLASLMWHSDARLSLPSSLGGQSFFAFHVSPVFLLLATLSRALPLSMTQFFAAFIGAGHGLLALAVFWLLAEGYGMRRGVLLIAALAASLGFAFSGLAVAIALYPHFEMFEAAWLLLFLVALILGHSWVAVPCFALAVATREDAGLHAALLLALAVLVQARRGFALPWGRAAIGFAAAGVVCGAAALAVQHALFPGQSSLARVYLGTPPFAHVDGAFLIERLLFFLHFRAYLIFPALGVVIWAVLARSPYPVLGFAACLPWTALHLLAVSPMAGAMVGYYAFPFLLALAWPLLGALMEKPDISASRGRNTVLTGFLALLAAASLPLSAAYNPGHLTLPEGFLRAPSRAQQATTDRAVAALAAARPALGRLAVDDSIAALAPLAFARQDLASAVQDAPPDTVAMLDSGRDAPRLRAAAARAGLAMTYRIAGTRIWVLTNRGPDRLPTLDPPLVRESRLP